MIGTADYCKDNIIINPFYAGDILANGWTFPIPSSTQTSQDPCVVATDQGAFAVDQIYSGIIPAGRYALFWRLSLVGVNYSPATPPQLDWSGQFQIAGSPTTFLWSNSDQKWQTGSTIIDVYPFNNPVIRLAMGIDGQGNIVDDNVIQLDYLYLCPIACEQPFTPTEYCFQLPMIPFGANLLETDNGCLNLEAPSYALHTEGIPKSRSIADPEPCSIAVDRQVWDNINQGTTAGANGGYNWKWRIFAPENEQNSIVWGQDSNGVSKQLEMRWTVDSNEVYIPFSESELEGCYKSQDLVMISGTSFVVEIDGYQEKDDLGNLCRLEYTLWNFESYLTKMFLEIDVIVEEDSFYCLSFLLGNVTGVTVTVFNSFGTPIFSGQSDEVSFNKIFYVATLAPATDTLTFRFEVEDFINCNIDAYWEKFICELVLQKKCLWSASLIDSSGASLGKLSIEQTEKAELIGVSFNPQIKYCQPLTIPVGLYTIEIVNKCLISNKYTSQTLAICENTVGLSLFSWDHCNIKCVGTGVIDKFNYSYLEFFYIRADVQELLLEEEREIYRGIDGRYRTPYVYQQGVQTMQLWSMAQYVRRAVAVAMSGDFMLDGEAYQKINDDEIEALFQYNPASAIRVQVHKIGDVAIIRNCVVC